jgi:hypothetical protein
MYLLAFGFINAGEFIPEQMRDSFPISQIMLQPFKNLQFTRLSLYLPYLNNQNLFSPINYKAFWELRNKRNAAIANKL